MRTISYYLLLRNHASIPGLRVIPRVETLEFLLGLSRENEQKSELFFYNYQETTILFTGYPQVIHAPTTHYRMVVPMNRYPVYSLMWLRLFVMDTLLLGRPASIHSINNVLYDALVS